MSNEQTTFHRSVIKAVEDEYAEKDQRLSYVLYNLMTDINQHDRTLRRCAQAIRDRLAEMERGLDARSSIYQVHISNPANDMTEAIAKREVSFATLGVLLGSRMKELLEASKSRFATEQAGQ